MARNNRYLDLITAPTSEPIDIDYLEANEYLKNIDIGNGTKDNTLFDTDFIPAAREIAEKYMNRKLFTQTWDLTFDSPQGHIYFPFGQLQSVTSVKIYDQDNDATTESSNLYTTKTGDNGQLWLDSGSAWATTPRSYCSFVIRFICGWDNVDNIPKDIIKGIMTLCTWMYYNREDDSMYLSACKLFDSHWTISPR